jgi:hypothetical protein
MHRPRYSILLPTRNGAPFLARCIQSILDQKHSDFELIVSDNANDDGTQEVLQGFSADHRLLVVRSEKLLSVTENWTAALMASRGEYILMIGDDDLLLPHTLSQLTDIVERYEEPDCVTFNGYRYVTPLALRGDVTSYYDAPYFHYEDALPADGLLSAQTRGRLVERLFHLDVAFPLTMQLTLVRRSAAERLPNGMFKSVFPDHYAVSGLLLTARRWALVNRPLVVVGVSPKSFGQYFFNDRDEAGMNYLGVPVTFDNQLDGNRVLNATCSWLQETLQDFREQLAHVEIERGAYVARQIRYWARQRQEGQLSRLEVARRMVSIRPQDILALARSYGHPGGLLAVARAARSQRMRRSEHFVGGLKPLPGIANISEFAAWIMDPARS